MEINNLNDIRNNIDEIVLPKREIAIKQLNQIVNSLPIQIKHLIEENFTHKRIPKEYMLSSILFAFSNASGLAFSVTSMNYTNYPNLFFANIGSRGDTKSEPMKIATSALVQYDNEKYKSFVTECKENQNAEDKPDRKRLLMQNATIEAMKFEHSKNPYSIGIYYDELMYIFQKMSNNNSSEGADLRTFLLSGYNNDLIDISRRTTDNFRMEKTYPTLLGSIQTEFLPQLFANGNLESGLIDRILFTANLTLNTKLSNRLIEDNITCSYNKLVSNLLEYRFQIENTPEISSLNIKLLPDSEQKVFNYTQNLINLKGTSNETTKAYIAKLMITVHKLTLLVHLIKNSEHSNFKNIINPETVDTAILICEFYFTNFKIILEENLAHQKKEINIEALVSLSIERNVPQSVIAQLMNVNKSTISRHVAKLKNQLQLATNTKTSEDFSKYSY